MWGMHMLTFDLKHCKVILGSFSAIFPILIRNWKMDGEADEILDLVSVGMHLGIILTWKMPRSFRGHSVHFFKLSQNNTRTINRRVKPTKIWSLGRLRYAHGYFDLEHAKVNLRCYSVHFPQTVDHKSKSANSRAKTDGTLAIRAGCGLPMDTLISRSCWGQSVHFSKLCPNSKGVILERIWASGHMGTWYFWPWMSRSFMAFDAIYSTCMWTIYGYVWLQIYQCHFGVIRCTWRNSIP